MRKNIRRGAQDFLGDVLRRVPLTGVGEIRVPSDLKRVLIQNIENMRENALEVFAKEISKVLAKVDIQHILDDVLKNYSLRVEAKVDLVPKTKKSGARKGKK